ncbi:MAG TPA: hypothetical protein EYP24_02715 [bacterium (Candidatus Stahlbacteria)]|nr:hypothetical protein [Candidatus Stahlbacteria bacterium]
MVTVVFLALSGISSLNFANHLYETGDYDLALLEYYRYHLENPDEVFPILAISECYLKLNRFQRIPEIVAKLPNHVKYYILGRAKFYEGSFDSSIIYLRKTDLEPSRTMTGLAFGHLFQFDSMASYLGIKRQKVPSRSPVLSGMLGMVPGLGHIYAARHYDGIFAFFFTSLFAGFGYLYYRKEEKTKGAICFTLAGIFYLGSIVGAINAAKDYSFEKRKSYLKSIRDRYREEEFSPLNLWR